MMRLKDINIFKIVVFCLALGLIPLYGQISSAKSGAWNADSTWTGGIIPGPNDHVQIISGHIVTLNTANAACNDLTITGSNSKLRFAIDGTSSGISIFGHLTIGPGAFVRVESRNPAGAANSYVEHTLRLYGNLRNSGTLDLRGGSTTGGTSTGVLTSFLGSKNDTLWLTSTAYKSSLEEFNGVVVNKSNNAKIILASGNVFMNSSSSVGPAVLTFVKGIIETGSNIWVTTATGSASVAGGSDSGYISGIQGRGMNSSAETEKKFEIGDANGYRPIIIRTTTGGIASGHYVFASIVTGNANTGSSFLQGNIDSVSRYRYYRIGYSKGGVAGTADTMKFKQFSPFYRADDGVVQNMYGLTTAYSIDNRGTWVNAGPTNHVADLSNPPTELQSSAVSPELALKDSAALYFAIAFGPANMSGPVADIPNGKYGALPLHSFDLWKATSDTPTPLVIHIHGGGLTSGSKADISLNYVSALLAKGISVMSINYRLSPEVVVPQHYIDCARAIQYARQNAALFNIDPKRIGASGSSAGGLTSFWLNFHDDLADPHNADSVLRQSSRLKGVACWSGQTTVDVRVAPIWVAPIVLDFTSYFRGTIFGIPTDSMYTPSALAIQEQASPAYHVTSDDPPVWMYYSYVNPPANSSEAIHHVGFGNGLKHIMDSLGLKSSILTPAYGGSVTDSAVGFFIQQFGMNTAAVRKIDSAPAGFSLEQNYPNPFNPSTTIIFTVAQSGFTTLKIFDILGKEAGTVINEELPSGKYRIEWNAGVLSSGLYFYRLQTIRGIITRSMLLLK
jgi:hypothetical protein